MDLDNSKIKNQQSNSKDPGKEIDEDLQCK